jgi:nuclear transport factor 2 (NTF2) superfamily protein
MSAATDTPAVDANSASKDSLLDNITWDEAQQMLRRSEDRFQRGDIEGLISRYDDDIIIRFADLPEIKGKAAAERFFRKRFAKQKDYTLKKELFLVAGQKIANTWTGAWTDGPSGKKMQGRGVELIEFGNGKVVRWEASFNVWEVGNEAASRYFDPA